MEYEPGECVFMAGVLAVDRNAPAQLWQMVTEKPEDEARLLHALVDALEQWPALPIVTWNGWSADFPQLDRAWLRAGESCETLTRLRERHVDVYRSALSALRLPLQSFRLSEVAAHFGHVPHFPGVGGWEMPMLYRRYVAASDDIDRQELKGKLLGHNEDDLRATWHAYGALSDTVDGLTATRPVPVVTFALAGTTA